MNSRVYDILSEYEESTQKDVINQQTQKNIQQNIKSTFEHQRRLYYIIKNNPEVPIDDKYIKMLISAGEFQTISYNDLTTRAYFPREKHILNHPFKEVGLKMAGITPLLQWEEVKSSWDNVFEVTTAKTIGVLISSIATLFLGELSSISLGVFMLAVLHCLSKIITSGFKSELIWKSFISFLLVFFWISASHILSFSGFLAGSAQDIVFTGCLTCIGFAELKGIVETCEAAGYEAPKVLKTIASSGKNPFK